MSCELAGVGSVTGPLRREVYSRRSSSGIPCCIWVEPKGVTSRTAGKRLLVLRVSEREGLIPPSEGPFTVTLKPKKPQH